MPFDETKPLIAAAFTCEKVLSEDGPIFSAVRIVDRFTVSLKLVPMLPDPDRKPPPEASAQPRVLNDSHVLDVTAFVMLRAGQVTGVHEMAIVVRDPEGKERPHPEKAKVEFKLNDPAEAYVLSIKLMLPHNAPVGRYWINVLWDSELLTKIPISLSREVDESLVGQLAAQSQKPV